MRLSGLIGIKSERATARMWRFPEKFTKVPEGGFCYLFNSYGFAGGANYTWVDNDGLLLGQETKASVEMQCLLKEGGTPLDEYKCEGEGGRPPALTLYDLVVSLPGELDLAREIEKRAKKNWDWLPGAEENFPRQLRPIWERGWRKIIPFPADDLRLGGEKIEEIVNRLVKKANSMRD